MFLNKIVDWQGFEQFVTNLYKDDGNVKVLSLSSKKWIHESNSFIHSVDRLLFLLLLLANTPKGGCRAGKNGTAAD